MKKRGKSGPHFLKTMEVFYVSRQVVVGLNIVNGVDWNFKKKKKTQWGKNWFKKK